MNTDDLTLDLHRLDLRFAATRLAEPRAVAQIAQSIERSGQVVPCLAVATGNGGPVVLVDGYRRVAALRRLGHDTARVDIGQGDLADALIKVLARNPGAGGGRCFAAIEEALQIRVLTQEFGLSQSDLARRSGRDVSWVNRRLVLLAALPDSALDSVREGRLSTWVASRILAPLARAKAEHAERLLASLQREPLSSRELGKWFEHYQTASRSVRERMVDQPRLFVEALRETAATATAARLRDGPEGECATDLRIIEATIRRLTRRLPGARPMPAFLRAAAPRLRAALTALINQIEAECDDDDSDRTAASGAHPERAGQETTGNQPDAVAVP